MAKVDVVIATYNRHASLQRTLEGLMRQRFRDFRVILVDDGSTPPVAERLPPELQRWPSLQVLSQPNSGPAVARNIGVAAGEAPFVAFIDDDVVPGPEWLEEHFAALDDEATVSIGPLLAPADWRPTAWNRWEAERLETEYRRMLAGEYKPTWRQFFTGNVLLSRRLLEAAGPFRPDFLRAEDIELALRLRRVGAQFVFTPSARGWHYARRPLRSWLALPRQYARYDLRLHQLHPEMALLTLIQRELDQRHPATRHAAKVIVERAPVLRAAVVRLGLGAAVALHALGVRRFASQGLSFVYDLEYRAALRS